MTQLHGVAQGLKYIHDADLAYGDLKGVRVLRRPEWQAGLIRHSQTSL